MDCLSYTLSNEGLFTLMNAMVRYNESTKKYELEYDGETIILQAGNMQDAEDEADRIIKKLEE